MLKLNSSSKFKKDLKRCAKRHYDMHLLNQIVDILRIPAPLPPQNREHNLSGNHAGERECHIEPDWILIYRVNGDELYLVRTGTHADLFDR
jgi:mRNA interferase YafQ